VKTKLAFIVILLLAVGVQAQTSNAPDPASWQRYTVKNEEFSVTLPTLPAMVTNKLFSSALKKERRHRLISVSADGVTYTIEAYENPKQQQSLDQFIAEQATDSGIDVSAGRSLTISEFSGREFPYKQDGKPATEQFFATENNLYRFAAHGASMDHAGVKQFFASIALCTKQQGLQVADGIGQPLETATGPLEQVYSGREVDQRVKLKDYPEPEYPPGANQKQLRGLVILRVVFAADGKVKNIEVLRDLPGGFTEKAIEAAKKIKFIPATKDGKFVSMWMQLEYNFNLY
jgi:TonB family protein